MHSKKFNEVLQEQIDMCQTVLSGKASEYATDDDRLHNFKTASALQGCTASQALAGMMAKHTVSIYDMCYSDSPLKMSQWEEKITDHLNYLFLLKAVLFEESLEAIEPDPAFHSNITFTERTSPNA